ncbi:hypothetical protein CAPTEDRAFT_109271 [Capitella teleta]|uniref:Secreted protein n=1 Tax=Capitella teleta TaxID=283909 RepID=R7VFL8_CAPTE|nr:hypothetical protein CAPTEDRAFT_109271 [Capitella teleta]|eukprot:ELU17367.1 hypothetical protein CAPTEDRAFT_109271 [Capitella teleta]
MHSIILLVFCLQIQLQRVKLRSLRSTTCFFGIDAKKLSGDRQTSSIEAFHSLILQFAPKLLVFFFNSMQARLQLAALHFNRNAGREQATPKSGVPCWAVTFPKAKRGD